jgi:hypothetical protein
MTISAALLFLACVNLNSANAAQTYQDQPVSGYRYVYFNQERISDYAVSALEQYYQVRIVDGRYWYDRVSGAVGAEGGPTVAFILPDLNLGGRLRADASRGKTGVFVNGRELTTLDVSGLQRLLIVYRARYWLDAWGNMGYEGQAASVNLIQLAQRAGLLSNNSGGGVHQRCVTCQMYDSGIGRVIGGGGYYGSGSSSASRW